MADKTSIHAAIEKGIVRAADSGYTKTYDIAIAVIVEISRAGLKVVNKPAKDGVRVFRQPSRVTVKGLGRASRKR
jgi:hypothetical protein